MSTQHNQLKIGHFLIRVDAALRGVLVFDVLMTLALMISYITIPWWIIQKGTAQDLAIYGGITAMAIFFFQPLMAPICERYAKQKQLVQGTIALAFSALLFCLIATFDRYNFWLIITAGLVAVVANAFIDSAATTITPELIPTAQLAHALQLRKRASSTGRFLGPIVGGGLLATAGITATLWAYLGLVIIAILSACNIPSTIKTRVATNKKGIELWWIELQGGIKAKWAVPLERGWTLVNFLVWIFIGPAFNLFVPLKVHSLGLSAAWLGACEASISIGMLLGSFNLATFLINRFGRYRVRIFAAISEGLILACVALCNQPYLLIMAFMCAGLANTLMVLVGSTHRALAIPKEFRIRISSVNKMSTQIASTIGPALAGIALLHWPLPTVYMAFSLIAALCAAGFILIPRSKEFFSLDHEQVNDWYRKEYPSGFKTHYAEASSRAR
ncbi:MFS transporter [Iodobacter sp.]|uniref:MFS transporter n=1 Tax=Iodobacter sp. TaxID=1915058 RepID=UPI0025D4B99A|nr:MFS transporter [Iodobacter sp.]